MSMDFKTAYAGFNDAIPDGNMPKINAAEDPSQPNPGKDGTYEVEIVSTEEITRTDQTRSFKAELILLSCDNGRFSPGTKVSFMQHNMNSPIPYLQQINFGNVKAFLAAAFSSKYEVDVKPTDPTAGGSSWLDILQMAFTVPETLAGARIRINVLTQTSNPRPPAQPRKFAKCTHTPLPRAEEEAAA